MRVFSVVVALVLLWGVPGHASELSLVEAFDLAAENDPRLAIAKLQLDSSEARKDAGLGRLLPQVTATGQLSKNSVIYRNEIRPDERFDGTRYGVQLSQAVLDLGSYNQFKSLASQVEGQAYRLDDEQALLVVRTAEAYLSVLATEATYVALGDELTALDKQLEQGRALADRQLLPLTDLLEITARRDLLATRHLEAENNVALAKEGLYQLLGDRNVTPAPLTGYEPLAPPPAGPDALISEVFADNPRLKSLQADQEAADRTIDQSVGSYFPTVSLTANRQFTDVGFDNQASPPRDNFFIGLNVNWSLLEGGAGSARLREAWANYYVAGERITQEKRLIERELRSAWLGMQASLKLIAASEKSVESARLTHAAAKRAVELGTGRIVDVLLALSAVTRAEVNLIQAQFDNVLAYLQLHYVAGDLSRETLASITGN